MKLSIGRLFRFWNREPAFSCRTLSDLNRRKTKKVLLSVSKGLNLEMDELKALIEKYDL